MRPSDGEREIQERGKQRWTYQVCRRGNCSPKAAGVFHFHVFS